MDSYDSRFDPPAPVINVIGSNPYNPAIRAIEDKALIDSGAFKTVIPVEWVSRLSLLPVSVHRTRGYKIRGERQKHHGYIVRIAFKKFSFDIEAISARRENVLIGRDILNHLRLILDGKNLNFEIADP